MSGKILAAATSYMAKVEPMKHLQKSRLRRRAYFFIVVTLLLVGSGCAGKALETANELGREAASPVTVPLEQGHKATDKLKAINELQENRNQELESVK